MTHNYSKNIAVTVDYNSEILLKFLYLVLMFH